MISGLEDPMSRPRHHLRVSEGARAFTLIELLVVISIITLLIAALMPALSASKAMSKTAKCLSNERQIAIAIHAYVQEQKEWWPIGTYAFCGGAGHEGHDSATWGGVVAYYGNNPYTTDFSTNAVSYPGIVRYVGVYGVGTPEQGILKCPADPFIDAWNDGPVAVSYGYNGSAWGMGVNQTFNFDYPVWYPGAGYDDAYGRVRTHQVRNPARTVMNADMEQPGGYEYVAYQLSAPTGWGGFAAYHPGESANALFVDGHATVIKRAEVLADILDRRK
jgi:prepilin-type N-terminal cleavage/methylation domain-containing protein/prepilin-type processing-associated H-X9-DG protein